METTSAAAPTDVLPRSAATPWRLSPFAAAALLLLFAGCKLLLAAIIPITADESLHWLQGQHPAAGYADHPPGTALLGRLATDLLGVHWFGLRAVPILGTLLCSWIAWAILREVGASRERAMLGAVGVQLVPMVGFGVLMVPAVPHAPLVFAAELALIRLVQRRRWLDGLLFGLLFGAALLTYYLAAALLLAVGCWLLGARQRWQLLADWRLWAGAVVAVLLFLPNLWWNMERGSGSAVHFQLVERHGSRFSPVGLLGFLLLAAALAGPLWVLAMLRAGRRFWPAAAEREPWESFFASAVLLVFAAFAVVALFTRAGAHWAVLAYLNAPLLLLLPGSPLPGPRWIKSSMGYAAGLAGLVVAAAALGLLQIASWLPADSADSRDRALRAAEVATVALRLGDQIRAAGGNVQYASDRWSFAAILSFHAAGRAAVHAYPPPSRHGRDFRSWPMPTAVADLVYINSDPEPPPAVVAACQSLELVQVLGDAAPFAWIFYGRGFVPAVSSR